MTEFIKTWLAGAWVSILPLKIEAALIGLYWWNNSRLEMAFVLTAGLMLAWACHTEIQAND